MTLEQLNIVFQLVGTLGVIGSLIFVGLQVRQNTKATRELGFIDQKSWTAWSEHILIYFNQPAKMSWEWRRGNFNLRFRTFVESSPAPKVPTMVEIMRG
jgi:hypothetical protein